MANKIIQWNIRGIKADLDELILLISNQLPDVVCLQETFLKENDTLNIKNYSLYNYINKQTEKNSRGTTIIINNKIAHKEIKLQTNMQAIAVSVTLHKKITICSLYIPPNDTIKVEELKHLIKQLSNPFILMGHFNSHNEI